MPDEEVASTMDVLSLEDMSSDKVIVSALRTSSDCSRCLRWLVCYAFDSIDVVELLSLGQERPEIWLTLVSQDPRTTHHSRRTVTFSSVHFSELGYPWRATWRPSFARPVAASTSVSMKVASALSKMTARTVAATKRRMLDRWVGEGTEVTALKT
jgi:hypothetical protein